MTQIFTERGETVPVTVLEVGPCVVTQVKTVEKDGVRSVQLGFGHKKRLKEPERGHLRASGAQLALPARHEDGKRATITTSGRRSTPASSPSVGDEVDVTSALPRVRASVVPSSVTVSRWPQDARSVGSPSRPGSPARRRRPAASSRGPAWRAATANDRVTVQNLEVVRVDPERSLVLVKGSVPGPNEGLLLIRRAIKVRQREALSKR
ncbi:MAG: 50S ribosomal protein L3 [Thermomicrobiales bacterium]